MHIDKLISSLPKYLQYQAKFINVKESEADLSKMRIGQELATNLLPKAVFARSIVDLCDNAFRELIEVVIVYVGPKVLGEKVFRKLYTPIKAEKKLISTEASKLLDTKNEKNKEIMPIKAAIAVSALAVPLAEYSLSYLKNLFTLKVFKQGDFNNIANLNKVKTESSTHKKQVEKSAKKHISIAAGLFAGCLAFSGLLLSKGKNSKALNSISEFILAPGNKLFKNNQVLKTRVNKYFGLDFRSKNGKLAMSNGQLTASVVAGFFGYTGAAKDRGKQDYKEVLYRFPLVGFYAITGSEMVESGFKKLLAKTGHCKEILNEEALRMKNPDITNKSPKLEDLANMAEAIAKSKSINASEKDVQKEFKKLFKQKSAIIMIPYLFSLGFMGFFVAGISRVFTKYRYNKELQTANALNQNLNK